MAEEPNVMSLAGRQKLRAVLIVLALLAVCTPGALAAPPFPPDVAPIRQGQQNQTNAVLMRPDVRDPAIRAAANPVRWDALNMVAASAFDRQHDGLPGEPLRIGVNRPVPGGRIIDVRNAGTWHMMPDGTRLWSLQLEAPGAQAIRVHFKNLGLGEGTRLIATGGPAFVPEVLYGRGRMRTGGFWSTPIAGDVAYLEYQDPTGKAVNPTIVIDEVTHIYRGFADENGVAGSVAAGTCEQDVLCFNTDMDARDSVARILFNDPIEPGAFLCTGALLVDADPNTFAGYFLTANHCISTQEGAASVTAYWFYQTDTCNGRVPSLGSLPRSQGATLLATSNRFQSGTDSTLLRLSDDPFDGQTFASWTTTTPSNGATVVGIHHPWGSFKRYSEGITTLQSPICSVLPTSRYIYNDWTIGQTEGGSSGSPLFNTDWQIVGQLFGFCSFVTDGQGNQVVPGCDNQDLYNNVYGKLSVFFNQISSLLLGVIPDDGFEDNDALQQARIITPAQYQLRLVDFDDYFSITVAVSSVVTADASFSTSDMDLNLELLKLDGTVLSSSTTFGRFESVSATVSPGIYLIRASKNAGWGGDYTLNVTSFQIGCSPPAAPVAVAGDIDKNRFISFVPGDGTDNVSYAITLITVQDPQPPNSAQHPAPDMSWLNGSVRWVGAPSPYTVSTLPPVTGFAAPTNCTTTARDWSSYPQVHVYGPEIAPSSTYEIRALAEGCDPGMPGNFSDALVLTTARWGDIVAPFQDPLAIDITQPDVQDLVASIDAVKGVFGSVPRLGSQLRTTANRLPRPPSVADVVSVADAVKGFAYPFGNISDCP